MKLINPFLLFVCRMAWWLRFPQRYSTLSIHTSKSSTFTRNLLTMTIRQWASNELLINLHQDFNHSFRRNWSWSRKECSSRKTVRKWTRLRTSSRKHRARLCQGKLAGKLRDQSVDKFQGVAWRAWVHPPTRVNSNSNSISNAKRARTLKNANRRLKKTRNSCSSSYKASLSWLRHSSYRWESSNFSPCHRVKSQLTLEPRVQARAASRRIQLWNVLTLERYQSSAWSMERSRRARVFK